MAPVICHLINSIIRTGIFPDCLKVSKVIPILKPSKPSNNTESFRPVNCLLAIEKLGEGWIKSNLTNYFETNKLFNDHHHGGRKGYSTVTAKAVIDNNLHTNLEQNTISGVLSCDLSSCFETIDHKILSDALLFHCKFAKK